MQVIQPHTSGSGSAGTTTYAYAGNQVTVTDPAGRWKKHTQNAIGNLVQVTEPDPGGGSNFETYYTYNLRNQLTQVQMPRPNYYGGTYTQTRTFVYDATTAFLTSATNPENGTTTYNYSPITYLLNYRQDAKGQKLEYTYDANNRVTKITPKDPSGNILPCEVTEYFYDLSANTYGRLAAVQYGSKDLSGGGAILCPNGLHREEYSYTAGGRPTNKTLKLTRKFADLSYAERTAQIAIDYEYDTTGDKLLKKVTYPTTHTQTGGSGQPVLPLTGSIYQYTFDSMGRPTGETRTDPSLSPVTLVDQVTYNTFGALTQMRKTIPNQTETRSYDAFQRMTSMTMFDQTVIAYNYASTANDGKIVSQTTTPSGGSAETVNYTYDSLGRLTQAATAGAGGWGMSWMYDGWGNRLQQSAVKGTVPTITTTTDPATNRITAHTYDANGNTTYAPLQGTMTYDALNRLATVASDIYGYDAGNKRIWKNTEFTFWGARGERIGRYSAVKLVDDASQHVFVFQKVTVDEYFGGRRLTTQDRLGSVGGYYPYGEAKAGSVSNADSFATYYRDSTGLDYADQRQYSASYGRFMTSDPYDASADLGEPSAWNRYVYVASDPVNHFDSSGLFLSVADVAAQAKKRSEPSISQCIAGGVSYPGWHINCKLSGWAEVLFHGPQTEEDLIVVSNANVPLTSMQRAMLQLGDALAYANMLLGNAECRSLFQGVDPRDALSALVGTWNWGSRSIVGGAILFAQDLGTSYAQTTIFGASSPSTSSNLNVTGNTWANGQVIINTALWVDRPVMSQAMTLIHELGHLFNFVTGLGSSGILDDDDADSQKKNRENVEKKCLK